MSKKPTPNDNIYVNGKNHNISPSKVNYRVVHPISVPTRPQYWDVHLFPHDCGNFRCFFC